VNTRHSGSFKDGEEGRPALIDTRTKETIAVKDVSCFPMTAPRVPLNKHTRPHLLVGLALGLWLYLFLALIGPFDAAELPVHIRFILMTGYGLVFFLSYALLIPVQSRLYDYLGKWELKSELGIIALFCVYCLPICFAYYKTDFVNGTYSFVHFALGVYLPILALILPVLLLGRYLIARRTKLEVVEEKGKTLTLLGENKLDVLKVTMADLVAIESANNYVTVYYMHAGQLKKKLLRSSLKKMQTLVPEMVQVHRSYLVNTAHFVEWKDGNTLFLTQLVVPVSQTHKSRVLAMTAFVPK